MAAAELGATLASSAVPLPFPSIQHQLGRRRVLLVYVHAIAQRLLIPTSSDQRQLFDIDRRGQRVHTRDEKRIEGRFLAEKRDGKKKLFATRLFHTCNRSEISKMSTAAEIVERFDSRCSDSGNEHGSAGSGSDHIVTTSLGNNYGVSLGAATFTSPATTNIGDFCTPHPGFRSTTLFDTPESLVNSPQYEMFSPSATLMGRGTSTGRCASCSKTGQLSLHFNCSHRTCNSCASQQSSNVRGKSSTTSNVEIRCGVCGAGPAIPTNFPPTVFFSPSQFSQHDAPRTADNLTSDYRDGSILSQKALNSVASRSLSASFAKTNGNDLTKNGRHQFGNILSEFNGANPIEPLNMWNTSIANIGTSSPAHDTFESLNMVDDAPVFSPLSPPSNNMTMLLPPPPNSAPFPTSLCQGCADGERSEAFCVQCKEFLCPGCVQAHQRVRATKHHKFVTIQQFFAHLDALLTNGGGGFGVLGSQREHSIGDTSSVNRSGGGDDNSGESSPRAASVCEFHEARIVCVCDGCDSVGLCASCITGHPAAHHLTPIGDVRLAISELANESRMCDRACEMTLEGVRNMSERVQNATHAAEAEICAAIFAYMSALEDRKRDLLSRVDTIRQVKLAILQAQAERILSKRSSLQQMLKLVDSSMDAGDDDVKLKEIFEQLVNFKVHENTMTFQLNENDLLKFHGPDVNLLTKVRHFGDLESGPCAKTSVLSGENFKRSVAGRASSVLLQVRDACGEVVPNAGMFLGRDILVSIYSPNATPVEITSTKQRDNGILEVCYYPALEGTHTLNVLIRGVPIAGCPTTIDVRRGRNYDDVANNGPLFTFGREGFGDGELCRPWGICVDLRGRVLVADRSNNRVQVFDKDGNFLSKFGTSGNRPGQFDRPAGITTNSLNNIIVADKDNHRVQVFDENGNFVLKFGERGRTVGMFNYPWGVACNTNNFIAVSDTRNHRVQIFSPQGQFIRKCGFDSAYFFKNLDSPRGLCYLPDGQLLITDFNNHRLAVLAPRNSSEMKVYGSEGDADGMFVRPQGVKTDSEGNILVCDSRNNRIQVFAADDMRFIGSFGLAPASPGFQMPAELPTPFQAIGGPFGAPGFTTPTPVTPSARPILDRPTDLAVGPDGRIYVVDFGNNCIRVF
ncbi:unnamed protein product [Caenorhabditis auriculariae]|uniref:B box-type domain-containing protein n=1 Tax=Caenorhabditis auriculariae TaxID=2777116 RepID=A0A8S1HLS7_9PELO|nr:unnamed protein product [Caenorhabditis auriculariae]